MVTTPDLHALLREARDMLLDVELILRDYGHEMTPFSVRRVADKIDEALGEEKVT